MITARPAEENKSTSSREASQRNNENTASSVATQDTAQHVAENDVTITLAAAGFHEIDRLEAEAPGTPEFAQTIQNDKPLTSPGVARRVVDSATSQPTLAKMPELSSDCLDSLMQLTAELDRMYQIFKSSKSLPSSNQPYAGDIHKQRQALSRALVDRLKTCTKPDTFKLELTNAAIEHKIFDNRTMRGPKNLLTGVVRTFWRADNPTPIMPSQSQFALLAYRGELVDRMKAEVATPTPR